MLYNKQWEKPEIKTEEWRKVLRNAADLIEYCGWVKHQLGNENIGFCSIGAIETVTDGLVDGGPNETWLDGAEALFHLGKHINNPCVATWNDYRQRTKRQVIEAMRAAAEQQKDWSK